MVNSENSIREVRSLFTAWRKKRGKGRARIPEELWAVAVKAAKEHGPTTVCREIGLDYNGLKRRLKGKGKNGEVVPVKQHFLEVPLVAAAEDRLSTVELVNTQGYRMVVRFCSGQLDVTSMIRQFMEVGS